MESCACCPKAGREGDGHDDKPPGESCVSCGEFTTSRLNAVEFTAMKTIRRAGLLLAAPCLAAPTLFAQKDLDLDAATIADINAAFARAR
jgi:hypothetical protein